MNTWTSLILIISEMKRPSNIVFQLLSHVLQISFIILTIDIVSYVCFSYNEMSIYLGKLHVWFCGSVKSCWQLMKWWFYFQYLSTSWLIAWIGLTYNMQSSESCYEMKSRIILFIIFVNLCGHVSNSLVNSSPTIQNVKLTSLCLVWTQTIVLKKNMQGKEYDKSIQSDIIGV